MSSIISGTSIDIFSLEFQDSPVTGNKILILWMRKLGIRELKQVADCHIVGTIWDSNSGLSDSKHHTLFIFNVFMPVVLKEWPMDP